MLGGTNSVSQTLILVLLFRSSRGKNCHLPFTDREFNSDGHKGVWLGKDA